MIFITKLDWSMYGRGQHYHYNLMTCMLQLNKKRTTVMRSYSSDDPPACYSKMSVHFIHNRYIFTGCSYTGATAISLLIMHSTGYEVHIYDEYQCVYCYSFFPQAKKINRVACGSAHTLAWSTSRAVSTGRLPSQVPIEYDLLKEVPLPTLRNRLVSFPCFILSHTALEIRKFLFNIIMMSLIFSIACLSFHRFCCTTFLIWCVRASLCLICAALQKMTKGKEQLCPD